MRLDIIHDESHLSWSMSPLIIFEESAQGSLLEVPRIEEGTRLGRVFSLRVTIDLSILALWPDCSPNLLTTFLNGLQSLAVPWIIVDNHLQIASA